jgi:hypothetical protein
MAAREELEAAQADDFLAQLDAVQGMGAPISGGFSIPQMGGMPNEAPVTEGEMMPPGYAFGGKKFDGGGWEDFFKILEAYQGSLGESAQSGKYAVDRNTKYWNNRTAAQVEAEENYGKFTQWIKENKDNPNVQKYFEYLDKGINRKKGAKTLLKYDKDGKVVGLADDWENTFDKRRTDKALGIYHLNPQDIGFLSQPEVAPTEPSAPTTKSPIGQAVMQMIQDGTLKVPEIPTKEAPAKAETKVAATEAPTETKESPFKYRSTWQRDVPWIGASMAALYGMLNKPDYSNADRIIEAAYRMGRPINIPVETIGDYRKKNPFDERYLVNMANQNRAAAARSIANTAGGNRSMDLLGAMTLAHNGQTDLGEIMRQAYLANRTDDAQVADFNRGTNVYNMSAINQRNMTQAQLNTHREQAGLSGLSTGYGLRQSIKNGWEDFTIQSLESALASLGAKGKENEEYNMLTSMAEQGYYPYYYGDKGIIQFAKPTRNGGKLNHKKRRF